MFSDGQTAGDEELIQIVDLALADAAARSGAWLVCKPGCTQCCTGSFAINALDRNRLRAGLERLRILDPHRAQRLESRVAESIERTTDAFPGDARTGMLGEDEDAQAAFEDFANDEVCPVLDPETGRCDLYTHRPMTCRVFGPPVRSEEGLGVCELCYTGATGDEIAACEMRPDPDDLEGALVRGLGDAGVGESTVTFSLMAAKNLVRLSSGVPERDADVEQERGARPLSA